jgi:hypothetical protein
VCHIFATNRKATGLIDGESGFGQDLPVAVVQVAQ